MSETPLMKQYKDIKDKYKDAILFFRLGDFYEMFFDDAKTASRELGLTLTSRNKEKDVEVPLAGIPYHSSASYISKLVAKGYKVAICEQLEDPKEAKGIVKRDVVKIITPGTVIDTDYIDGKSNNYIMAMKIDDNGAGLAYIDITTGEFYTTEIKGDNFRARLTSEMYKISPKELIVDRVTKEVLADEINGYTQGKNIPVNVFHIDNHAEEILKNYFNIVSVESFGISDRWYCIEASAAALQYVLELQKYGSIPVSRIVYVNISKHMELNSNTQKNLELTESEKHKNVTGSLLWVLDSTKTAMGGRYLKRIINNPLTDANEIIKRQSDVDYYINDIIKREEIKEELKNVYDIERLIGKIILGTENGKDLVAMKKSLGSVLNIDSILADKERFDIEMNKIKEICRLIETSIKDDAPFTIREGGMIKKGYNSQLDELHEISNSGKDYILAMEQQEKEKTGIKSLKIGFNKIFGYYIEVTNMNKNLVPINYIRKQTLSNAERFITPELKEYEDKILNAKDKIEELEYSLFKQISGYIKGNFKELQEAATKTAYIDSIISLADAAVKNNYVKPEIIDDDVLDIKDGRHPVVEKLIGQNDYVKNDIFYSENERVVILTGPNMAGKSTYMKQSALIILMAQIGSYVPAESAKIGIVDKIFTRVGASDDIVSGQSTFMVEMSEVANIINNATSRSFIILDEVGRGTSTFDGISLAWAITEYLSEHIKAKTIFATHYHEMTELERAYKNIVNFRVEVKENEHGVLFLRKIVRGGADKSYGIEVAKLAGLPDEILKRSRKILYDLEKKRDLIEKKLSVRQLSLFDTFEMKSDEKEKLEIKKEDEIIVELRNLDINILTPMDALNKLNELKKKIEKAAK